ncbi:MAG: response regulator [Geminicoccales bacterium]
MAEQIEGAATAAGAPRQRPMPAARRPAILLVDDEARNLSASSEILSELDAEIVCVASGREALRQVLRTDFAVILLDIRMPEMDGYETAALIRQRDKSRRIPIIFLSAVHKDEAHVFRGYSAGAVDYVFKPVEPVVLRAKVAVFIELHKQADEIRRQAEHERRLLEENIRMRAAKMDAERKLRSSEARQALVIQSLPIALYEAALAENGVVRSFLHDNVVRLLGFEPSHFQGDTTLWASRVHPDDWPAARQALDRVSETGDYAVEYRWRCADGAYRYFLDQGVIARGSGDEARRIFGTMLDVHERHMLQQQLVHAQKIEAVGKLTGGIAHDFNNMLTVVIGNLDRVSRSGGLDPKVAKRLDFALQGALRCSDMTRRLLAFARRQPLSPQSLNINELINDLTELLDRTFGEHIELKMELASDLWPVFADPTELEAVIVNLLVNSRDAMPNGGRATIRTFSVELDGGPSQAVEIPPGAYVALEVADTGVGMTKEILARSLEPFFTTKGAGQGTGLGLSTIYGFVRQSGGDLVIASAPGEGTTVRIYLPRGERQLARQARRESAAGGADIPRARSDEVILAVEDDTGVRESAAGTLRDLGYRVIEAEDADAALRALERVQRVSLLFTDLIIPGRMDGYRLAREAIRRNPDLKVLYTSAHGGELAAELGTDALRPLLEKPYRDYDLARAVRDALG